MKKKLYKRWWFWVILGVVSVGIIGSAFGGAGNSEGTGIGSGSGTEDSGGSRNNMTTEKSYQKVDLQTMLDELHENALWAESKYQNAYVEITGKISNFDSDGSYIAIEPVAADEWNFDTVMCYIKNDTQKSFILEKSVGDQVTIKGEITSIGEILGYSLNIEAIS